MSPDKIAEVLRQVERAATPEDFFGVLDGTAEERLRVAKVHFRTTIRTIHTDVVPEAYRVWAHAQTEHLLALWEEAQIRITSGIYGQLHIPTKPIQIKTKRQVYTITGAAYEGTIARVFPAKDADGKLCAIKITRAPADGDLLMSEAEKLKTVQELAKDVYVNPVIPTEIDRFKFVGGSPGIVYSRVPGLYTLEEVRAAYPEGVDGRTVAWMARRLLFLLGVIHRTRIVHGGVTPAHVLIHPEEHAVFLVGWSGAVEWSQPLRIADPNYKSIYPPEVWDKAPTSYNTDLYMAGLTLSYAMGFDLGSSVEGSKTSRISRFFQGLSLPNPRIRPRSTALELHDEFTALLNEIFGVPTYHKFVMPPGKE